MKLIFNFIIKEFMQFKRDKKMFMVVLIAPVLQLIFFGYAVTLDIKNIHTVVLDYDRSQESRDLADKFEKTGYFTIDYYVTDYNELTQHIDNGNVLMGLVIPPEFSKNLGANKTVQLQTIFDGSDGNKAAIAAGYVQGIISSYTQKILVKSLERKGFKTFPAGSIQPEVRVWYNPELTTRNYMLPGIVGLLIMLVTTILTSLAVVKEREIGTLEQLIVTPIKPYQMILGKIIPFSILGFVSVTLVITVMRFWFLIPVKGSVIFLFFSSFLFMLSALGLGLFISTISKTQMQAMITAAFSVIMPMMFLSGFTFPIENMPQIIQYVTYLVPLRYFIVIIRGIILKGIGITDLWSETLLLLVFGILILILSSLRFKKNLG